MGGVGSKGDTAGNTRMMCETASWVAHYFSNPFLKLKGNEYCSKLEKEFMFQVTYTPSMSYFLDSPWDI